MVADLQKRTRTTCGFAALESVAADHLMDWMPSFFLSETLKYLYLLFDEGNIARSADIVFTTEGHLLKVFGDPERTLGYAATIDALLSETAPEAYTPARNWTEYHKFGTFVTDDPGRLEHASNPTASNVTGINEAPPPLPQKLFPPFWQQCPSTDICWWYPLTTSWQMDFIDAVVNDPRWWYRTSIPVAEPDTGHLREQNVDVVSFCRGHTTERWPSADETTAADAASRKHASKQETQRVYNKVKELLQTMQVPHIIHGGALGSFAVQHSEDTFEISNLLTFETMSLAHVSRPVMLVTHTLHNKSTWQVMSARGAPLGCLLLFRGRNGPQFSECIVAEFGAGHNHDLTTIEASYMVANPIDGCKVDDLQGEKTSGGILVTARGGCTFEEKAKAAQSLGADAVVIINNIGDGIVVMSAQSELDPETFSFKGVSIPCVMISKEFGDLLLAHLTNHPGDVVGELSVGIQQPYEADSSSTHRSKIPIVALKDWESIRILGQKQWGLQLEKESSNGLWKVLLFSIQDAGA
jgi:hypothetical protein